jgi:hypothetical protein
MMNWYSINFSTNNNAATATPYSMVVFRMGETAKREGKTQEVRSWKRGKIRYAILHRARKKFYRGMDLSLEKVSSTIIWQDSDITNIFLIFMQDSIIGSYLRHFASLSVTGWFFKTPYPRQSVFLCHPCSIVWDDRVCSESDCTIGSYLRHFALLRFDTKCPLGKDSFGGNCGSVLRLSFWVPLIIFSLCGTKNLIVNILYPGKSFFHASRVLFPKITSDTSLRSV